jgi:hypothetical protein
MKYLLMSLFICGKIFAAPILNENVSPNINLTIYQDHQNPNLYYFSPKVLTISTGEEGIPYFSYTEYYKRFRGTRALIQATMDLKSSEKDILEVQKMLKNQNSKSQLVALPFKSSQVKFGDVLNDFMIANNCSHNAGTFQAEQSCSFVLNQRGSQIFKGSLKKRLTVTLDFEYEVQGVNRLDDFNFKDTTISHTVAGRLGGEVLSQFPELFVDEWGNILE